MTHREIRLVRYPQGTPSAEDFTLAEAPHTPLEEGDVRIRVEWLSMDPLPRIRMAEAPPMGPPMRLGAAVEGRGGGTVIESRSPAVQEGDLVTGEVGWREEAVMPAEALTVVDGRLGGLDAHLGVLGASGLTAILLAEKARAAPGETLLVAPAAGSVGMVAVQLLARRGARVAALIGGEAQASFVTRLGASSVIDHQAADLPAAMAAAMPGGWDAFLDGVGGASHDAALPFMKVKARLVLFGFVSDYGTGAPPAYGSAGPILMKRATAEGFLLADHAARFGEARMALAGMLKDGTLEAQNAVTDGLENAPAAFAALFGEARPGKQLVRL